jgi:glycogen(starch) synthase
MARILTLTNWYPPHHFGGYEVLCDDVMSRLASRGHEVEVLCSNEQVLGADPDRPNALPVHRDLQMYWQDGSPWTPGFGQRLAIERANQQALRQALDAFQPDVVSVWHMGALSLSLLSAVRSAGIPILYSVCDEWLIYGIELDPWSRTWFGNPFRRQAGRLAQARLRTPALLGDLGADACFAFLSEFTRTASRVASPWHYPVDPVIYPGIDRSMFPPPAPADVRPWGWKLLYTSRLDARKGADTLLRAMTRLPQEATLSMLSRGEPAEQARLTALAEELGLAGRVRIEGIGRSALAEAYLSHDCFIFPSEWPEPFGMVPLEAMACGTPVVATGVGGSGEFLVDGTNYLQFEPGNHVALAAAITRLAADEDLRRTLRTNGWVSAEQFDLESTVEAYDTCHRATAAHTLTDLSLAPHPSRRATTPTRQPHQPANAPFQLGARVQPLPEPCLQMVHSVRAHGHAVVLVTSTEAAHSTTGLVVIGDPQALPFRSGAFASVVSSGELERVQNDQVAVSELARVSRPGGQLVVVSPNRHNVVTLRQRLRDRWRGWTRSPEQYFTQPDQCREYAWGELEHVLAADFSVEARIPIGWEGSPGRRLASRLLVGPFRRISPAIRVTGTVR